MRLSLQRSSAAPFDTGGDERRQQLAQQRQQWALQLARRAGLPELRREDVSLLRYGYCEHDGATYRIVRGDIGDQRYSPATAFYLENDAPVFLELVKR